MVEYIQVALAPKRVWGHPDYISEFNFQQLKGPISKDRQELNLTEKCP